MSRPNFLLIMTDQHRADHLGCYGNSVVRTPNIDAIARSGTRFTNFFVNCPICMPNRIAMMTGRMPTTNGSRHNGIPLDTAAVTYVDLLRHAGYRTAFVGKSHLQDMTGMEAVNDRTPAESYLTPPPEPLSDATRQRRVGPEYEAEIIPLWIANPDREVETPYYGFDHVRFANGHADNVHGHYDKWVRDQGIDLKAIAGRQNALPGIDIVAPQAWRTAVPEALYSTRYIEQETCAYLRDHAAKGGDSPFFIQCSFPDPHHPFTPPGRYFDMYDPDEMPLPATFDQVGENEHPFIRELRARRCRYIR